MGHHIQAFVGSKSVLDCVQKRFGVSRVVELNQGLFLLPLIEEFYDTLPSASETFAWMGEFQFLYLDSKVVTLLEGASKDDALAYIETDYFGGDGSQGAVVARERKIIFGPAEGDGSISAALRMLGAKKGSAYDEFEAVGLGRFRRNEDWIEQPRFER